MGIETYIERNFGGKKGLLRLFWFHSLDFLTRRYSRYRNIPSGTKRLVFVCKGNICRSALAEHYFRSISSFPTTSIGLDTHTGKPANDRVLSETQHLSIRLSTHKTTAVEDFTWQPGDLFVCMEPSNITLLKRHIGDQPTILLGLYGDPQRIYVHDPYNAKLSYLRFCNSYIICSVESLNKKLIENNQIVIENT